MSHPLSTAIYSYIPTGNPIEEEEDPQIHKQDGELKKLLLLIIQTAGDILTIYQNGKSFLENFHLYLNILGQIANLL